MSISKPTLQDFIEYEIAGCLWASLIWFDWGQQIATSILVRRALKKYHRYLDMKIKMQKFSIKF
jgi:hypothetical protein